MAKTAYSTFTTASPQRVKDREDQVKNSAGGFVYAIKDMDYLDRFLILGSESPTYYASAQKLTQDAAKHTLKMIKSDGLDVVKRIEEISKSGRAAKNSPALFALALAISYGDTSTKRAAAKALPNVARTATHLFEFVGYANQHRGWGRVLKDAVAAWYTTKSPEQAAYQVVKYRSREGWTHKDVLRLSKPSSPELQDVFSFATGKGAAESAPKIIHGFNIAKDASTKELPGLISTFGLTWEMLPDSALKDPKIWDALVASKNLPVTAAIRNLGRMTSIGISDATVRLLVDLIDNEEVLVKGRVHPLNILQALKTYQSGRGVRGSLSWTPNRRLVDALDSAFYKSFKAVEPTNKRILLALDVSGSMGMGDIAGSPGITPRIGSVAMSMVTAASEKDVEIVGFTAGNSKTKWGGYGTAITPLDISPRRRLDDNIAAISRLPFGGTDCALPMLWAAENNKKFDAFVVYTDNETWVGNVKPDQALRDYRRKTGIDAKLIVVGMTATQFSIADPNDPGMLDVVGFDSSAPAIMSGFIRG